MVSTWQPLTVTTVTYALGERLCHCNPQMKHLPLSFVSLTSSWHWTSPSVQPKLITRFAMKPGPITRPISSDGVWKDVANCSQRNKEGFFYTVKEKKNVHIIYTGHVYSTVISTMHQLYISHSSNVQQWYMYVQSQMCNWQVTVIKINTANIWLCFSQYNKLLFLYFYSIVIIKGVVQQGHDTDISEKANFASLMIHPPLPNLCAFIKHDDLGTYVILSVVSSNGNMMGVIALYYTFPIWHQELLWVPKQFVTFVPA